MKSIFALIPVIFQAVLFFAVEGKRIPPHDEPGMSFQQSMFRQRLEKALLRTKEFLHGSKFPTIAVADDVPHSYDDKYQLAEFVTRSASVSLLNALRRFNISDDILSSLIDASSHTSVMLRFTMEHQCTFDHWAVREEDSIQKLVVTETNGESVKQQSTKIVNTVNESFWQLNLNYGIYLFRRDKDNVPLYELSSQSKGAVVKTTTPRPPYAEILLPAPIDLDITWLFQHLSIKQLVGTGDPVVEVLFSIDRDRSDCKTPLRNAEVQTVLDFFVRAKIWAELLFNEFNGHVFPRATKEVEKFIEIMNTDDIFVPVLPLFREQSTLSNSSSDGLLMDRSMFNLFLAEESNSLDMTIARVDKLFPNTISMTKTLFGNKEAHLLVLTRHLEQICSHLSDSVYFIEDMLTQQFAAAIGKTISPSDLSDYMDYHTRHLLLDAFAPKPFTYSVRRNAHSSPEGLISIEANRFNPTMPESSPVKTIVHRFDEAQGADEYMSFPIDAATNIRFRGERYLHAWLQHTFAHSSESIDSFSITASARQFSSFILVLGRVTSAYTIEPTHSIIVRDKDFLRIPLNMEVVPSAKEFRDATRSLSPEQQRFAKAFRSMQLSSTIFVVCTIQIKPQLEKVLNLVPDSLTKEIKLTQDLLELFIDYQIPSDLLSFSEDANMNISSGLQRVEAVRESVAVMKKMISDAKDELIENQKRERTFKEPIDEAMFNKVKSAKIRHYNAPAMEHDSRIAFAMAAMEVPSGFPSSMPTGSHALRGGSVTFADEMPIESSGMGESMSSEDQSEGFPQASKPPSTPTSAVDISDIPTLLDSNFDQYCNSSVLRPSKIIVSFPWKQMRQHTILSTPVESSLAGDSFDVEKKKAFELLDALTKSGGLTVEHASMHVVISATHSFDKTLLETIIQDNINPIEQLEQSILTAAATVHRLPVPQLLQPSHVSRVSGMFPLLSGLMNDTATTVL